MTKYDSEPRAFPLQISLIAVGTKMPEWINVGFREYAKRLPHECRLNLIEIPASSRSKAMSLVRALKEEGDRLLSAVPKNSLIITLEISGQQHSTESLANEMRTWMSLGRDVSLLVGGADGLAQECLSRAEKRWSLSRLTLPHPLVRVILAEQIYRAWSLLSGHPYHRGERL